MALQYQHSPQTASREDNRPLVLWAALLATWMGCLFWLSLTSSPPEVPRIIAWDKLQHAVAYAVLTLFSGRFFICLWRSRSHGWWSGFALAMLFGLFIEFAQGQWSERRVADWHDLIANGVGAMAVLSVVLLRGSRRG